MAIARTEQRREASTNYALVGIAAVSLAVFALFAVAVWHLRTPIGLDDVLQSAPKYSSTLSHIVWLGTPAFGATAVGVVALVALAWRDVTGAAICLVSGALAASVVVVAKPVVGRLAGAAGEFRYPSGHATVAATVATVIVLVAYRRGGRRAAAGVAWPAAVIPLAVSVALVRLGLHYPTDTVGGIAVGVGAVCATAAAFGRISRDLRAYLQEMGRTS